MDKLERFMRGELSTRGEGPLSSALSSSSRSMLNSKGDVTPGTPSSASIGRHPPAYQRMHSNESAKGSDKEANSRE